MSRFYFFVLFLLVNVTICAQSVISDSLLNSDIVDYELLEELRSAEEYAYIVDVSKDESIFGRIWRGIKEFIAGLFSGTGSSFLTKAIFYGLTLFALICIFYFVTKSKGSGFFEKSKKHVDFELPDGTVITEKSDLKKILAQSISSQDFKKAVQVIYIQSILFLGNEEVLKVQKFKSNAAYQSEISEDNIGKLFSNLTEEYEYVHFGDFEATEENVNRMISYLENLKSSVN